MAQILTLAVHTDDGSVEAQYGVEHEGKLWVVTSWLIDHATGKARPERMIRVDTQPIQKCVPRLQFDYTNIVLPRDVLDGTSEDAPGYEIRNFADSPVVDRRDLKILPSMFPRH